MKSTGFDKANLLANIEIIDFNGTYLLEGLDPDDINLSWIETDVPDDTLVIEFTNESGTTGLPSFNYSVFNTGELIDLVGNEIVSGSKTVTDQASPVIKSIDINDKKERSCVIVSTISLLMKMEMCFKKVK